MGDPADYLRLIRPVNSVMVGFAVIVGAVIGGGVSVLSSPIDMFLAFVTGFTLSGSAMAVNDYYDREIDAMNEPGRPIPSGAVKPGEALAIFLVLGAVGLASSWKTGIGSLVVALLAWLVGVAYSTVGKKTGFLGNLMVSSCVALPFIYGGVMTGLAALRTSSIFALIAFISNTGREVTKGIVDIEGDRSSGVMTVAVSRGPVDAAWVSALCYVAAVVVSLAPSYLGLVSFWYIPFVAITDIGLLSLSFSLIRNPSRENSRSVKNGVRLMMLIGLVGFLAGSLL